MPNVAECVKFARGRHSPVMPVVFRSVWRMFFSSSTMRTEKRAMALVYRPSRNF